MNRSSRLTLAHYWVAFATFLPAVLLGAWQMLMNALEADEQIKVVVFDSAVEGFFLNHSDFRAKLEDLTTIPQGPTGLEA